MRIRLQLLANQNWRSNGCYQSLACAPGSGYENGSVFNLQCALYFVCSVLYILFAACCLFCLQRILYFICSVLYILFAVCSIFCLQCVLYFVCSAF